MNSLVVCIRQGSILSGVCLRECRAWRATGKADEQSLFQKQRGLQMRVTEYKEFRLRFVCCREPLNGSEGGDNTT